MCLAASYWARIDRVLYGFGIEDAARAGFDDPVFYQEFAKAPGARAVPEAHLLEGEARTVLEAYAADSVRARY
ncbi:putative cytidine deaminase [Anaeromyxobacter sp. K]|uniref:cytidine deaminase n=1 Tax=Anaeromyxobacter sp. (strain K) TaxID=447217 RepID=UPI00015F8938|nr:cytidine deaminase [Anaeromyxobacter sp. K]ACG75184.1 putative cytidine deaminase [Anaeromyxobacter sp. K]